MYSHISALSQKWSDPEPAFTARWKVYGKDGIRKFSMHERIAPTITRCSSGNVGVGLAGIRERLKELGGSLEIESNLDGTILKATIPASLSGIDTNNGSPTVPSQEIRPSLPAD